MAVLRLIDALPDFGAPVRLSEIAPGAVPTHDPKPPVSPAVDVGEIVRTEVAMAEAAVAMRLSVAHEAALLGERQHHAERMEALRRDFGEQAGALIADRLAGAQQALTLSASAVVARLVGKILTDDLRKRSIAGLAGSIGEALRDGEAVRIEVRGPQSLFAALAVAVGAYAVNLHHIETDDFDLAVSIDGSLFETRIAEWSHTLAGILG